MSTTNNSRRRNVVLLAALFLSSATRTLSAQDLYQGCTFQARPDDFLSAQSRARHTIHTNLLKLSSVRNTAEAKAHGQIQRVNLIDDEIFGRLDSTGVAPARLTTDEEFVRRIHLDLTGRIPSPDQIRGFLADTSTSKRSALIDRLLSSPEFTDKWTMWLGDLLQNTVQLSTSDISRQFDGRNAFYRYLRKSVETGKSIHDIAWEVIAGSGNNFSSDTGMVNFMVGAQTAMGPRQDTLDMAMVKTATAFLGMGQYDCIACHSGRGHLDSFSLWGKNAVRMDAWKMSAFFARTVWNRDTGNAAARQYTDPLFNSTNIYDGKKGTYDLSVTYGNRPARCANALPPDPTTGKCAGVQHLTPEYRVTHAVPSGDVWRASYADYITSDPMFARNFANRLWKAFFNLGLVDPVDSLDPDRLDPKNPPPDPWTLQATHPQLLEKLAQAFREGNTGLREYIRLLVNSSAYQLSSEYDGEWKFDYVPLFARHYPRRLDGEEVHDAIAQSTGVLGRYMVAASSFRTSSTAPLPMIPEPFVWAMSLPDTSEPRSNGDVAAFLNSFLRGNRDTQQRSQSGSILQQLSIMNDAFVTSRTRVGSSPVLASLAKMTDDDAIVSEIFLTFLSRQPSSSERAIAKKTLATATTTAAREAAVEDLAWAAINKVDFLFSY